MKHRVEMYGRNLFWVSSASREDVRHLVDLEPELTDDGTPDPQGRMWKCGCEADAYNVERPCRHVRAVIAFLKPVLAFFSQIKPLRAARSEEKRVYKLNPTKTLRK